MIDQGCSQRSRGLLFAAEGRIAGQRHGPHMMRLYRWDAIEGVIHMHFITNHTSNKGRFFTDRRIQIIPRDRHWHIIESIESFGDLIVPKVLKVQ